MIISIVSDLHNEFVDLPFNSPKCDIAVIAGDLDIGTKGIAWINKKYLNIPVIYVPGNHEYYHSTIETINDLLKPYILQNSVRIFEKEKIVFIGTTLWTDYDLYKSPLIAKHFAEKHMNDFRVIDEFTPNIAHYLFNEAVFFINDSLNKYEKNYKTVVVTHHLPSLQCVAKKYKKIKEPLNASFASNLEYMIYNHNITLWICGHSHQSYDSTIGQTRIIMNSRGYPHDLNENFNETFTVEI